MENKKENFNDVKYSFGVTGMACVSCSGRVEQKLKSIAGIKYAAINVSTERGFVIAEPRITLDLIKKAVIETGYGFSEKSDIAADETAYLREMKNILISSLIPAVFLMILMIFHYAGVHIPYMKTIEIVCGLFSFFVAGRKILKSAYIAVVHFHANMDVLISLSSLCALSTYFLSFLNDKIISFAYLSTMLITIHIIGKYIESSLKFKVSNDVRKLIGIQNNLASLIKENEILQVDVESVKKGDEILIKQGERILLDGIMIKGEPCYLDESLISGESTPVLKKTGDNIIAGSVSVSGIFHLKVEKTGKDTFLKQIIKLIEESQSSKIPIQAFADKLTLIFIPSIFAVSILSALAWFIFFNELIPYQIKLSEYFFWISPAANRITASIFIFISALVIACPCAIGLAIPMALASASGIAARRGLIIKNAETIQTSKDIDYIFLDKTGTITEGKPEVIEYGVSKEIFSIIASLEKRSEHPLAKSICGFAEEKSFFSEYGFEKVQETAGEGIKGILNNTEYFAGKPLNPESYSETLQKGRIVIEIRVNNQIQGFIALSDKIKKQSFEAIDKIKKLGITPVMLTGDNELTAKYIASQLNLAEVKSNVKPEEKVNIIREYQMKNYKTAMVGDGINDAAALKSADIGIAVGTGSDIAIDSADIIIKDGDLNRVIDAIKISRFSLKKIKQNLFFSLFYNSIAIPLAAMGLAHPLIAETAMALSSINVIINSSKKNY